MRKLATIAAFAILIALAAWQQHRHGDPDAVPVPIQDSGSSSLPSFLPTEARPVVRRILADATHPYRQDGTTFQNRERLLPQRPNGYYREYTVPTPGARDRGARRIVTGGDPPVEFWYTADHYRSFRPFEVRP